MQKYHRRKPDAILQVGPANPATQAARKARRKGLAKARRSRRTRYSKKLIRDAIIASNGILSQAARQIGCSRNTITKWIDKHPDLDLELQQIKESYIDFAESSLLTQVGEKNTQATIFLLRSLGRKRGWVDSPQTHLHAVVPAGSGTWLDIMQRVMLQESNAPKMIDVTPEPELLSEGTESEDAPDDSEDPRETAARRSTD